MVDMSEPTENYPDSRILVTGAAGFIGYHVSTKLLESGVEVIGLDNLNDYYDPSLKEARLGKLADFANFAFERIDVADRDSVDGCFKKHHPTRVVHLAAQAGVRYSLLNPHAYIDANINGHLNILEGCRHQDIEHLVFASTSSVYGANTKMPFSVHDNVDHPVSLYAATKKSGELMAHTYSHLFGTPISGLRFFTVYGPWGRPDMALFIFTRDILAGKPINVFNRGKHRRSFTYVGDIAESVVRVLFKTAQPNPAWSGDTPDPGSSKAPFRIYNIGNPESVELMRYIEVIEECLGKKATMNMLDMQPGDVPATSADVSELIEEIGFEPKTSIETGISRFVEWYRGYYGV